MKVGDEMPGEKELNVNLLDKLDLLSKGTNFNTK